MKNLISLILIQAVLFSPLAVRAADHSFIGYYLTPANTIKFIYANTQKDENHTLGSQSGYTNEEIKDLIQSLNVEVFGASATTVTSVMSSFGFRALMNGPLKQFKNWYSMLALTVVLCYGIGKSLEWTLTANHERKLLESNGQADFISYQRDLSDDQVASIAERLDKALKAIHP